MSGTIKQEISNWSIDSGVSVSFTRPANTTAYAVGDAVSNSTSAPTVLEFENIAQEQSKTIIVQEAIITSSQKGSPLPQFNLWLFNASPTAINDNAAFSLSDTENNTVQAVIPLTSQFSATLNSRVEATNLQRIVRTGSSTNSIYALLEVTNVYTPASGETLTITLKGISL